MITHSPYPNPSIDQKSSLSTFGMVATERNRVRALTIHRLTPQLTTVKGDHYYPTLHTSDDRAEPSIPQYLLRVQPFPPLT